MYFSVAFLIFIVPIICLLFYEHGKSKKQEEFDRQKNKEKEENRQKYLVKLRKEFSELVDKYKNKWKNYKNIDTEELTNEIINYVIDHPSQLFYPHVWDEPKDLTSSDLEKILNCQYNTKKNPNIKES